jgi:UDP-N-acetylmuramyl pentapeptide phosphotransferase/UDP-N-acetylglucosamine-1-phosphate transferase
MVVWLIAGALGAALGSNVLTRWLVPRLEARSVFDIPNQRSLHVSATVRGAGLAVALTWGVCFLLLILLLRPPELPGGFAVLGLAIGLSLVGFWDDLRSLNPGVRLLAQVVLCSGAVVLGLRTESLAFPGLPVVHLGSLAIAICAIGLLTMVNFFNFMDGIDGIAIGQTLVAAIVLLAGAIVVHAFTIAVLSACLAGAAAGFLPFNWSPARCFMGDAGSYFCGGTLGALLILGQDASIPLLLVGLASVPFLADSAVTLAIRLAKGDRIWRAHRSHIYQRMVSAGWSHAQVAELYIAIAVAAGAGAILYLARTYTVP